MSSETNPDGTLRSNRQLAPEVRDGSLQQSDRIGIPAGYRADNEDFIDLREYWHILVRRKGTIATLLAVAIVVAVLVASLATPIFRAETLVQINREEGKVLEYQDLTPQESVYSRVFYQTQYELLRSRNLAGRVIDQLGLHSMATSAAADTLTTPSFFREIADTITESIKGDSSRVEEAVEPDVEALFLKNLEVKPVRNSRLVRVSYDSPDPKRVYGKLW